jgi:hypothetical protein
MGTGGWWLIDGGLAGGKTSNFKLQTTNFKEAPNIKAPRRVGRTQRDGALANAGRLDDM